MIKRAVLVLILFSAAAARAVEDEVRVEERLFDNVARVLSERFFDQDFREKELPKIVERYRARALSAKDLTAECDVVQEFLSNIPATHLALIKSGTFDKMHKELGGESRPMFGFELIEYDGKQYAFNVLEKGPADLAGLKRGDRIVLIDGVLANESPRLGWRTDDAFLPDPPLRPVIGAEGDVMKLTIERTPGKYIDLEVPCTPYSTWEATKASIRVVQQGGKRIGVIHFWLIHLSGPDTLLREVLEGEFASSDALVLDLRGRGGNGFMVARMLDVLDGTTSSWNKPVVALINEHSRSAKEVIAHEFRKLGLGTLVGERTAGAVIPVTMSDVGFSFSLMFPSFKMAEHTDLLEFQGVAPDVVVPEVGPYSAGADPIFEAGVREAVRLAGESPEAFAERRAQAAKRFPKKESRVEFAEGHRPVESISSRRAEHKEADPPGHDPRALDIWAKMIEARGGEEALRRHTYRAIRGKRNMGGMMEGTFEQLAAAPNKRIDRMTLGGMGTMESGFNGRVGWRSSRHEGARLMSESELADYLPDADFHAELSPEKHHRSIVYVGKTEYAGKPCHELRLTRHSGDVEVHFVDAETYLPVGWIGTVQSNVGPVEMIRTVDAFDTFDGEVVPIRSRADVGGMQGMITTVTEVSFQELPAGTFDPPSELAGE